MCFDFSSDESVRRLIETAVIGNISFGRAFLVTVEVRNVEVSPPC